MHHDHFHHTLRKPSPVSITKNELYDFAGIEIAAHEFGIVRKLLKRLDEDHVRFHEGIAYCGYAIEDIFGRGGGWSWYRSDEVDESVGSLRALVNTLESENHGGGLACVLSFSGSYNSHDAKVDKAGMGSAIRLCPEVMASYVHRRREGGEMTVAIAMM